jgi:hypothetical protein
LPLTPGDGGPEGPERPDGATLTIPARRDALFDFKPEPGSIVLDGESVAPLRYSRQQDAAAGAPVARSPTRPAGLTAPASANIPARPVREREQRPRPVALPSARAALTAFAAGSLLTATFLWLLLGRAAAPATDTAPTFVASENEPAVQPTALASSAPVQQALATAPAQQAPASAPTAQAPVVSPTAVTAKAPVRQARVSAPPLPKPIEDVPAAILPAAAPPAPRPAPKAPALLATPPRPSGAAAAPAPFVGRLLVDSDPAGARVMLNGKPVGTTPLVLADVPIGAKAIRVEMDGHRPWSSLVRIVADQDTRANAGRLPPADGGDSAPR